MAKRKTAKKRKGPFSEKCRKKLATEGMAAAWECQRKQARKGKGKRK